MQRQRKQTKIYRIEILQTSIWRDEESKVKYKELKYGRRQYVETREAKLNIHNLNTADVNKQKR